MKTSSSNLLGAAALIAGLSGTAHASDTFVPPEPLQLSQKEVNKFLGQVQGLCKETKKQSGILIDGKEACEISLDNGKTWEVSTMEKAAALALAAIAAGIATAGGIAMKRRSKKNSVVSGTKVEPESRTLTREEALAAQVAALDSIVDEEPAVVTVKKVPDEVRREPTVGAIIPPDDRVDESIILLEQSDVPVPLDFDLGEPGLGKPIPEKPEISVTPPAPVVTGNGDGGTPEKPVRDIHIPNFLRKIPDEPVQPKVTPKVTATQSPVIEKTAPDIASSTLKIESKVESYLSGKDIVTLGQFQIGAGLKNIQEAGETMSMLEQLGRAQFIEGKGPGKKYQILKK